MVGGGNPETNLRYQQLLGWNQGQLPLRITFGRRGKWFTWSILQGHIRTSSVATYPAAAAPAQQAPAAITVQLDPFSTPMGLDSGEAPSLPSGLKRFWKDSKPGQTEVSPFSSSAGEPLFGTAKSYDEDSLPIGKRLNVTPGAVFAQAHEAYSAGEWEQYADCFTSMGRDEWTFGQLTGMTSLVEQLKERGLTTESLEPHLAATLVRCERFLASIDEAFPELPIKMQERTIRLKAVVSREFDDLQISRNARREARVKVIREVFGDQAREVFVLASKSFQSIKPDKTLLHNLTVLAPVDGGDNATAVTGTFGDDSSAMPSPIWFKRIKDKWLIDGLVDDIADRTLNFSMWVVTPSNLIPEAERGLSITEQLQQLDRLRAADQTPWDEIEKRTNELLAKYTAPADKGRIHWMAAHVYGQSDIRGHGADVTRHAQEALRYERDPVQRGWLYMYLGSAAGLVEKREEATRWHLKSYLELLPFNLPEIAPELPTVGKFRGERFGPTDGEVDPDQVAVEVLQAAEVRARKEAELIRDLVKSRNVTIGLLQDLYGREYQADSDATVALRKLATEVLRDEAIVLHLLQRVWPDSIPKS